MTKYPPLIVCMFWLRCAESCSLSIGSAQCALWCRREGTIGPGQVELVISEDGCVLRIANELGYRILE